MTITNINKHNSVTVVEPVNLYGCTLGKNVFVGPFVEIQSDSFIGENTRIQSHSFICSNVNIGKDCFIAHGVMFTNDKFTNMKIDRENFLSTNIGDNVLIGSNSTILPVDICNDVVIGAGSVVTKNITVPGIYAGNPAKKIS
mgnify:FL=1|tara:strand:- start:1151 stop:1576 length:426 start_codon:yes stop_codon:yes gene_type:complete